MKDEKKVAIVTGGASGLGRAIVERFTDDGMSVIIADVNTERGNSLAESLAADGRDVQFIEADVTSRNAVSQLVEKSREAFGRIDVLVNNAGIVKDSPLLEISDETWDKTLDVNLKGCFLCTQLVARAMIDAGISGKIVNISSIQGVTVFPTAPHAPYEVSKAGIIMLTKQAAFELAPYGINFNSVGPGPVATEILEPITSSPDKLKEITDRIPLGRIAKPADIAGVVAFLASKDANYLNGITIFADGGRLTW